jgi:hypothetical protein
LSCDAYSTCSIWWHNSNTFCVGAPERQRMQQSLISSSAATSIPETCRLLHPRPRPPQPINWQNIIAADRRTLLSSSHQATYKTSRHRHHSLIPVQQHNSSPVIPEPSSQRCPARTTHPGTSPTPTPATTSTPVAITPLLLLLLPASTRSSTTLG